MSVPRKSSRSRRGQASRTKWVTIVLAIVMGLGIVDPSVKAIPADRRDSVQASVAFLREVMDQYHDRVIVYEDVSSAGNHFVTYGKIPSALTLVTINGSWTVNPHAGATSIRCEFQAQGFGGFYFLNGVLPPCSLVPVPNFGEVADAGYDLTGATRLTFWARGEMGQESVDFFVAGVGRNPETGELTEPFPGSSPRIPTLGSPLTRLTTDWRQYSINLPAGSDLSYVLGGFAWVAAADQNPNGAVFYLDDIEFHLTPDAREARLNEPRFLRSFKTLDVQPDPNDADSCDDIDLALRNLAFSYDNALVLLAFLAEGSADSVRRAGLIGDAFVRAARNDRFFEDGRIRTAYAAGDIALFPGWLPNGLAGTVPIPGFFLEGPQTFTEVEQGAVDVGNNAWVMIALLALHRVTLDGTYLDASLDIARFIATCRNDSEQAMFLGFQGGIDHPEFPPHPNCPDPDRPPAVRREFASVEHNLDVYAGMSRLFEVTQDPTWADHADHAREFVEAMWDDSRNCYLAGTHDPNTRNDNPNQLPLDVQAWSVLALPDALVQHPEILVCAETHHRILTGVFSGFDFNEDKDGIWLEGTGHMTTAYAWVNDAESAEWFRRDLQLAQEILGENGQGLPATPEDKLTTGFEFFFFRRLHVAATAWNVFAQLMWNPYYQLTGCRVAGVRDGAGAPADVLFVNGSSGSRPDRVVTVGLGEPVTVDLRAAPLGPPSGRYVLYVWPGRATNPVDVVFQGRIRGCLVNPTPLSLGELPLPLQCVLGAGIPFGACQGTVMVPGPSRAPWSLQRPRGFLNPNLRLTIQGFLEDSGAPVAPRFRATNAVVLEAE